MSQSRDHAPSSQAGAPASHEEAHPKKASLGHMLSAAEAAISRDLFPILHPFKAAKARAAKAEAAKEAEVSDEVDMAVFMKKEEPAVAADNARALSEAERDFPEDFKHK